MSDERLQIVRLADIEALADEVRGECGIPVPVERIAAEQGYTVARNHSDANVAGFALTQGVHRIIGINTQVSPRRQRSAIAHALGHILLHKDRALTVCYQVRMERGEAPAHPSDRDETEANWFTGALLMPTARLRASLGTHVEVGDYASRDELIQRMAAEFEVSREAMGWRLVSANLTTA